MGAFLVVCVPTGPKRTQDFQPRQYLEPNGPHGLVAAVDWFDCGDHCLSSCPRQAGGGMLVWLNWLAVSHVSLVPVTCFLGRFSESFPHWDVLQNSLVAVRESSPIAVIPDPWLLVITQPHLNSCCVGSGHPTHPFNPRSTQVNSFDSPHSRGRALRRLSRGR